MNKLMFLLKDFLQMEKIHKVLDLGAWKGYQSLFCASYGAKVTAVDDGSMREYKFPEVLKDHPSIIFLDQEIEQFVLAESYDLVILSNVIMFMERDFVLSRLIPSMGSHLKPNGKILLSFFWMNDSNFLEAKSQYSLEDFNFADLEILKQEEDSFKENHPPIGPHQHHFHYLLLQKKTSG